MSNNRTRSLLTRILTAFLKQTAAAGESFEIESVDYDFTRDVLRGSYFEDEDQTKVTKTTIHFKGDRYARVDESSNGNRSTWGNSDYGMAVEYIPGILPMLEKLSAGSRKSA